MALVPAALASDLLDTWLVSDGHPSTPLESGDRFAGSVSNWFSGATAGAFPCATATARRSQLTSVATAAFQTRDPNIAGMQLAVGLMTYMAGQVFGPGVASPPTAVGAGQSAFSSVFSNLNMNRAARANQMAGGVHTMAISTIVIFPPPISPPVPVM